MKQTTSFSFLERLVIIFTLISINFVHGQVETDTLIASQYFKKADSFLEVRKLDSSIVYFKKALPIYQKFKAWERVASCYNKISENQWHLKAYEKSEVYSMKALEICNAFLPENHIEKAQAYDKIGKKFQITESNFDKAIEFFNKALEIRKEKFSEDNILLSDSYNNLGLAHKELGNYPLAFRFFEKNHRIKVKNYGENHHKVSDSYYNIAGLLFSKGDYDQAINYTKKALHIKINHFGEEFMNRAKYYNGLGLLNHEKGFYDEALFYLEMAIKFGKREFGENHYRIGTFYNNIGNTYNAIGKHEKAIEYLKKAITIKINATGKTNLNVVMSYHNIARAYDIKNDTKLALNYNTKALVIGEKVLGKNHLNLTPAYQLNGSLYLKENEYEKAFKYLEKASNISKTAFGKNHTMVANSYMAFAEFFSKTKQYNKAIDNYQKALDIRIRLLGKNNSYVASTYNKIGDNFNLKKNYEKAILCYYNAEISNRKEVSNSVNTKVPDINQYFSVISLLYTLEGKARVYKNLYKQSRNLQNLNKAVSAYQKAETLINNIRQTFALYGDKVTFAKKAKELYQGAIEAQLLLYSLQNDQKNLKKAFYYAEKSKANTLKELLNDANAKNFTGLPANLVVLEKELRINKAFYQSKITDGQSAQDIDTTKITRYENKLFDINRRQDSLTDILEKNYPKYYQLKHKNNIVTVTDIQKKLDERTTLLEFFTADSTVYAFTISKNNIAVQELDVATLENKIEEYRASIASRNVGTYKQAAVALYQQLVSPIANQLVGDQLIIIPDGPLWHLNIELLLTQHNDSNNPADLSYLLHDYAISYANSANLLFSSFIEQNPSKKQEECLAFSFTDSTNIVDAKSMSLATLRDAGDDLPGTRKEIKAISEIIDGQYYFGSEAIEANFKKNAGLYNILHLALHGEIDNERPENSKLYFTKNKDTIEDNLLYSHELFALDIPAELTVLSACNTGSGKIAKGEGIMSLGSAFQYAGTKSLLLTSWEVSDQTTPELMKYFYTNLKAGMNKAKALQQAKLQYLKTADINRTHPIYWGGFYLVGDSAPIHFSDHKILYWILGLAVLGILILAMFWYRRKVKS